MKHEEAVQPPERGRSAYGFDILNLHRVCVRLEINSVPRPRASDCDRFFFCFFPCLHVFFPLFSFFVNLMFLRLAEVSVINMRFTSLSVNVSVWEAVRDQRFAVRCQRLAVSS